MPKPISFASFDPLNHCAWPLKDKLEQDYHNNEWGRSVYDDRVLFEYLCLEGAQAGLSWRTILKKREAYREAFLQFDIEKLAACSVEDKNDPQVVKIIESYDIVKHSGKIASVYQNAKAAQKLQQEYGSLSEALWQFVEGVPIQNNWTQRSQIPTSTAQSQAMSKFLKKHGFKFVGETICYAFMQAVGMVNDHLTTCPCSKR